MDIAIVADVHVKCREFSDFESKRFLQLIAELQSIKQTTIIIAGDLFDYARPTLEELELVNRGIKQLRLAGKEVIILAGNHEYVTRTTSVYDYINLPCKVVKHSINDNIKLMDWYEVKRTNHTPFDVLISHLRCSLGSFTEEYNIELLSGKYKVVILGDIHQRHKPFDNVYYTSSPYSTKFISQQGTYGYIVLNTETLEVQYKDLNLPAKRKLTCLAKDVESIINQYKNDLLKIEVQGTLSELKELPVYKNVTYVKIIVENIQAPIKLNTDVLQNLDKFILQDEVLKNIPKSNIKAILKDLKDKL